MKYEVRLDSFEGPLDLLYQMVKKNEIELNEISLARITEQYLEYTDYFKSFDLEVASQFILIAGELIELKTKYLLPNTGLEEEDDQETDLVARLQEYEQYKKLSVELADKLKKAENIYQRPPEMTHLTEEDYRLEIDLAPERLRDVFSQVLQAEKEKKDSHYDEDINYLEEEKFRVEDKIICIRKECSAAGKEGVSFGDLLEKRNSFLEIAVTLLALLELVARREVKVSQDQLFGQIVVRQHKEEESS